MDLLFVSGLLLRGGSIQIAALHENLLVHSGEWYCQRSTIIPSRRITRVNEAVSGLVCLGWIKGCRVNAAQGGSQR